MNRPRVLLLFSTSALGGAERSLTRMAQASQGLIDYQLATLMGNGPWCDWVKSLGMSAITFGSTTDKKEQLTFLAFYRLIKFLNKNKPDVLYVCGVRASFLIRLLRPFYPKLCLVHGVRSNMDSQSSLDKFFRLMELLTHYLVDAWITNSAAAKDTLVKRCSIPENRISVIYNGLENLPDRLTPLNARPPEILTVANLSSRKGYLEYLQAIRLVVDQAPQARFVFVGRDTMNGEIQAAISAAGLSSNVRWDGFQPDVSSWFRRTQLFVLPSLWGEGCPTSILEAFSYGLPVIAYSIDGIPELIIDSTDGYLVEPGNYQELASKILLLLSNPDISIQFGETGRNKVLSSFTLSNCVNQHTLFFAKILKKS
jgi:glycosyltransferase involved in cell wall biosynthesis